MAGSTRSLQKVKSQTSPIASDFAVALHSCELYIKKKKHPRAQKWQPHLGHLGPCGARCGHSALKPPANSAPLTLSPFFSGGVVRSANDTEKPVK